MFIPKTGYEANAETYEFKTKLREINGDRKNGKPKKEKKLPATSSNGVEPKKVKFEGTEPMATSKSTSAKASQDANFVTRDEFEYLVSKVKKIKGKYKQMKRDIYEYEDVPLASEPNTT